ncbi:hypothetical protein OIV83_000229 [Microbotryomycetes sp. JL201]|nr:hypothetical protein OIV83_000229 [Microbotryomycetes sp. JL201]
MDALISGNLDGLFSGSLEWIAPWAEIVLKRIIPGTNPWPVIIQALKDPFYPEVSTSFRPQMWFLLGLFIVTTLVIIAGLALRLIQGRFWLVHRIDRTVLIPNISVWFGVCALAYSALGMVTIVNAIQISRGGDYPRSYLALSVVWPAVLWLGIYSEIWATFAAYYIRRYGAHFQESSFKSVVAAVLPWVFPLVAIIPCAVLFTLGATRFNHSISLYSEVRAQLFEFRDQWQPAFGLDLGNLASILSPVEDLGASMLGYSRFCKIAFSYAACVMLLTMLIYVVGATLEITHLRRLAASVEDKVRTTPVAQHTPRMNGVQSPQLGALMSEKQAVVQNTDSDLLSSFQKQSMLLRWAATNRTCTAFLITIMLVENAAMLFWYALAPLEIKADSAQFQTIVIVSCWLNGVLSALVSLLLLFRSLDGSNNVAKRLYQVAPWLPLPPAVGVRNNETTVQQKTVFGDNGASSGGLTTVAEKEAYGKKDEEQDLEAASPYSHGVVHRFELGQSGVVELADVPLDEIHERWYAESL